MALEATDMATIAQIVAATIAQQFGGALPSNGQHMADTVDNRKWIANDKVTCKGLKKGTTYRYGDRNGAILSSTAPVGCGQSKDLNLAGYCHFHEDQQGVDQAVVKARMLERQTVVIVPVIERPALLELCKLAGLKIVQ